MPENWSKLELRVLTALRKACPSCRIIPFPTKNWGLIRQVRRAGLSSRILFYGMNYDEVNVMGMGSAQTRYQKSLAGVNTVILPLYLNVVFGGWAALINFKYPCWSLLYYSCTVERHGCNCMVMILEFQFGKLTLNLHITVRSFKRLRLCLKKSPPILLPQPYFARTNLALQFDWPQRYFRLFSSIVLILTVTCNRVRSPHRGVLAMWNDMWSAPVIVLLHITSARALGVRLFWQACR